MAERSKIEWCDATVNFWWGCTKVGPGCDHCYAEAFDRRTGGAHWGLGAPRRKIKGAVKLLHKLDNGYADWAADRECRVGNAKAFGLPVPQIGIRRKVFIQSMSDLFDLEVPVEWFAEAWETIEACDRLDLQIVTKRVSAVEKRLAAIGAAEWPRHAGLMITVVNQAEADRDVPRLLELKAKLGIPWVGLSMEPLLGPVDISRWLRPRSRPNADGYGGDHAPGWTTDFNRVDWVIVGGESGPKARPMHPDWARSLRDQCQAAGVPYFFKQWGEWVPGAVQPNDSFAREAGAWVACPDIEHDPSADMWEGRWKHAVVAGENMLRVGKGRAGALLDGREWREMPGHG